MSHKFEMIYNNYDANKMINHISTYFYIIIISLLPFITFAQDSSVIKDGLMDLPQGQIHDPQLSPSNPDIVAFSKQEEDTQLLYLYHVVSGKKVELTGEVEEEDSQEFDLLWDDFDGDEDLRMFEGDLTWRPKLDEFGMQWFAFLSSREGVLELRLGYLISEEELEVQLFTVDLDHDMLATPQFSPDGNSLVFVGDGDLYLEKNITEIIRHRNVDYANPVQITDDLDGSYFPSWSHDGKLLAYQSRALEGPREGYDSIFILDLEGYTKDELPQPQLIYMSDRGESGFDHLRPTWSPNERILSYYLVPTDEDNSESNKIRLARIQYDEHSDRYVPQDINNRRAVNFADQVYTSGRMGPNWTSLVIGDDIRKGMLWIERNPDQNNPIFLTDYRHYVQEDSDTSPRNLTSEPNEEGGGTFLYETDENRYPGAIQTNDYTRFSYVSQVGGTNQLQIKDMNLSDNESLLTEQSSVEMRVHGGNALLRAAAYPGLGHRYIGDGRRGLMFGGAFTFFAAATGAGIVNNIINDSSSPSNNVLAGLGIAALGTWALNVYDVSRQLPKYHQVPVQGTFRGYMEEKTIAESNRSDYMEYGPSKRKATMLSSFMPGMGQVYLGDYRDGFIRAGAFSTLVGATILTATHDDLNTYSIIQTSMLGLASILKWSMNVKEVRSYFSENENIGHERSNNFSQNIEIKPNLGTVLDEHYIGFDLSVNF